MRKILNIIVTYIIVSLVHFFQLNTISTSSSIHEIPLYCKARLTAYSLACLILRIFDPVFRNPCARCMAKERVILPAAFAGVTTCRGCFHTLAATLTVPASRLSTAVRKRALDHYGSWPPRRASRSRSLDSRQENAGMMFSDNGHHIL